ncbi:Oar protein [Acidisarcina polymorpha]|uniref:Oar protein n=2 Tax=Acidisarcina polymorpha TaxID=2211140 RepID=A0A2Z5FTS2_9BACT|nr:Oar protein [Acidisarcina polymorpha]
MAFSQTTTADVIGNVLDGTGSSVPGVAVTLTNLDTRETFQSTTNEAGAYVFNLLKPGRYELSMSDPNFKTFTVAPFNLSAGDRAREDGKLEVGNQSETVVVNSGAPSLQTDTSLLTNTISAAATQDLPLNARNYIALAQLTPGANEGPQNGLHSGTRPDDRRITSSVSINGQTEVITDQMVDGMDNNERVIGTIGIRPSVDAIQEIRVESNSYTAEAGRTAGGIVNVITKAGTDQFHGTAFEFLRNTALDAYPFQFGAHLPKQSLHQNQFGGSLGGPILHNRTFFFGAYEGFRLAQAQNPSTVTVPTAFERANPGNFSDQGGPAAIPNIDPVGLQYFNLFPAPTSSAVSNNYTTTSFNTQNSDTADARVDHRISPNDLFYARYSYNRTTTTVGGLFPAVTVGSLTVQPGGNIGGYFGPAHDNAQNGAMDYVHIFSPVLLLEAQTSYTNIRLAAIQQNNGTNAATAFGLPNVNIDGNTSGLSPVSISGYGSLGDGTSLPIIYVNNIFQYQAALTYTHGNHNVKFGGGLIRRQASSAQSGTGEGEWTFTTNTGTPQYSSLVNLLQGNYGTVTRNYSLVVPHYRTWEPHAYVQDDWHATPTLTLNLGIRYDVFTPFTEVHNNISNFDPVAAKIIVAGQDGVSATVNIPTDYSNLAPRVGFSKRIGQSMVLRGGFGFSFVPENVASGASLKNQPFVYSYGAYTQSTAPAGFSQFRDGLPIPAAVSAANPVGSIPAIEQPNFRSTYVEQFNLTGERDFAGNVVRISYVGMLPRHMVEKIPDFNAPALNTYYANHTINYNSLRPYYSALPLVTSMPIIESNGQGSYNALQVSFDRRPKAGLTVGANYTYARNLDDALATSVNGTDGYGVIPSQIAIIDYGNSDLDQRHRVNASVNYLLPFGRKLSGFKGVLAKGWQLNGIGVWGKGLPFTPLNVTNVAGNNPGSSGSDRPDQLRPARISNPTIARFFDTTAFVAQAPGTLGTERRNSLYGPNFRHIDLSLFKNFPIYERLNAQFRAEAFNVLNMANFGNPNLTLGTSSFGTITSLNNNYNPRLIQFALKLNF